MINKNTELTIIEKNDFEEEEMSRYRTKLMKYHLNYLKKKLVRNEFFIDVEFSIYEKILKGKYN